MTEKTNEGGPAFPAPNFAVPRDIADEMVVKLRDMQGMTLRDYFAAKAMQGYCAREGSIECEMDAIASDAYELADVMLAARSAS